MHEWLLWGFGICSALALCLPASACYYYYQYLFSEERRRSKFVRQRGLKGPTKWQLRRVRVPLWWKFVTERWGMAVVVVVVATGIAHRFFNPRGQRVSSSHGHRNQTSTTLPIWSYPGTLFKKLWVPPFFFSFSRIFSSKGFVKVCLNYNF